MKKLLYIFVIIFIAGFTADAKPANPPAGFGIFFSTLNPHGMWLEMGDGLVVWRPTIIRRGWAPYREGRWIWTVDGWYWDSYEPFGHVTYHYGRWFYDDYYGWIWIPDYEWAPAWVEWRYDDVYIGWAPLPPYAVFSINIGVHYTYDYYNPYDHWHFVTYNHFDDPYVYRHFVGHGHKHKIYSRTKYRTNYGYYDGRIVNRGVDVDYVRERSGREFRTRDLERVRDYDQVSSSRDRGNNDRIRTLYVPKDELRNERNFDRDVIKKSERKSSLNTSRVEIGERNLRDNNRNRETVEKDIRKERNTTDSRSSDNREIKRNETRNERSAVQEKRNNNNTTREKQDVRVNRENNRKTEMDKRMPQQNVERNRVQQKQERTEVSGRNNQSERMNRNEMRTQKEVRKPDSRNERSNQVNRNEVRKQNNTERTEIRKPDSRNERNNTRIERNNPGNERNNTRIERKNESRERKSNTRVERDNREERTKSKNRTR